MTHDNSNTDNHKRLQPAFLSARGQRLIGAMQDAARDARALPAPKTETPVTTTRALPRAESVEHLAELRIRQWMMERELEVRRDFKNKVLHPPKPPAP